MSCLEFLGDIPELFHISKQKERRRKERSRTKQLNFGIIVIIFINNILKNRGFANYWKVNLQILFCQWKYILSKQWCQLVFSVRQLSASTVVRHLNSRGIIKLFQYCLIWFQTQFTFGKKKIISSRMCQMKTSHQQGVRTKFYLW